MSAAMVKGAWNCLQIRFAIRKASRRVMSSAPRRRRRAKQRSNYYLRLIENYRPRGSIMDAIRVWPNIVAIPRLVGREFLV